MTKFRGPGNTWQKETEKSRLDCWWEGADLESQRFMFEGYKNNRAIEDTPKGELKTEEYLNNWWGELELKDKKFIYKAMMDPLSKEEKTPIFKNIEECLKEKLALLEKT